MHQQGADEERAFRRTSFVERGLPYVQRALTLGICEDEGEDLVRVSVEERLDGLEVIDDRAAIEEGAA